MQTPPDFPQPGQIIAGKYEIERLLGAGGMGIVVAARHVQLGQRVAIKFMRLEAAQDPQASVRFLREARAAAALSSDHVAKVLDVGTLGSGAPYMVMEYLAGVDLGEVIRRDGPLPATLAVDLVLQACEAVADAHSRGIVHRDLKPANLFLAKRIDGSPFVKVLDFGISKAMDAGTADGGLNLTATGVAMGSPAFMSPEQVRSTKGADARSDIWSLGVILYELLSGTLPFAGETLGDMLVKIASEDPPPLRELRSNIPPGLVAVVGRCLQKRVEARIQTVSDLATQLQAFGGPDAVRAAERIRRAFGATAFGSAMPGESSTPRPGVERPATGTALRGLEHAQSATGRPWQRSTHPARKSSRRWLSIGALAAALLVGATVVAARLLGWSKGDVSGAASSAGASLAATASATPSPSAPPPVELDARFGKGPSGGDERPTPLDTILSPPETTSLESPNGGRTPASAPGSGGSAHSSRTAPPRAASARAAGPPAGATPTPKPDYDHF